MGEDGKNRFWGKVNSSERLTKKNVVRSNKDDSLKIFYYEWKQRNVEKQGGICEIKGRFLGTAGSTLEVYILMGVIHSTKGENSGAEKGDCCQSIPLAG